MPLKPPPRSKMSYERVDTADWTHGVIEEIQRDEQRETGFKDKETGEPIIRDCVRFKFKLEGYEYPHYSNWMTFGYGEKFTLFIKYIRPLVKEAEPDLDFDLERLKNFPIKVMWVNHGEYQNVEMIRPQGDPIDPTIPF